MHASRRIVCAVLGGTCASGRKWVGGVARAKNGRGKRGWERKSQACSGKPVECQSEHRRGARPKRSLLRCRKMLIERCQERAAHPLPREPATEGEPREMVRPPERSTQRKGEAKSRSRRRVVAIREERAPHALFRDRRRALKARPRPVKARAAFTIAKRLA
eukprot:6201988-Pleurochrysis_carterae.AAC.1